MKGVVRVTYSTLGDSALANGVGIAGWRSGRFVMVAFSGRRGRLFLSSSRELWWARFATALALARSLGEVLVLRVAMEALWMRGTGVLYGAALIREAFA